MADTILTAAFSRPQFQAKNEATNAVVWQGIAIVDVDIDSQAALTEMPMAIDGPKDSQTTSNILEEDIKVAKIIQPVKLRVTALIKDLSMLEGIITLFNDETVTMSVNTKSIITDHLVMTDLEITQTADMISASKVVMTFEQAQPPAGSGYLPEQAADASVYGFGIQSLPRTNFIGTLSKAVQDALTRPPAPLPPGVLIDSDGGPFILNRSTLGTLL
jgi:hypothetical protein